MKLIKVQKQEQGYEVTTEDKKEHSIPYIKGTFLYKETKAFIDGGGVIEPEYSLDDLKLHKISEINQKCETAIISGFPSSALGEEYIYGAKEHDQLNYVGAAATGGKQNIKCSKDKETWSYVSHTATQIKELLKDGANVKVGYLEKYEMLKAQVQATTTSEELDQINW